MRKLFFDINITGHHSEYVQHLVNCISESPDLNTYVFVLHPDFSSKFPLIEAKVRETENIIWITVTESEFRQCQSKITFIKSFLQYKLVKYYAKKNNVDHVILLNYNILQIATIYFRSNFTMSGIFFSPFYRMKAGSVNRKILYIRKFLRTRLSILNPKIKALFVLNDQKAVSYLNRRFHTNIFKLLPDPIPNLTPLPKFDIYQHYKIERGRRIFLHFGSLRNSKGTFEIVDSLFYIPPEYQEKIAILIVGKALRKEGAVLLRNRIRKMTLSSNAIIIWDEKFASNEMMKSLFNQCYAVLMPYKNMEASSGIMGHAAAAHRPVIASGCGLIGELVLHNNLGIILKEISPNCIAEAIKKLIGKNEIQISSKNFVESHSPSVFAKQLLTS